jgi:hypothetical protein
VSHRERKREGKRKKKKRKKNTATLISASLAACDSDTHSCESAGVSRIFFPSFSVSVFMKRARIAEFSAKNPRKNSTTAIDQF